jgi:hypothetical protein
VGRARDAQTGNVYFREYLFLPILGQIVFGGVRTNTASALSAEIFLDATGHITVHQASGRDDRDTDGRDRRHGRHMGADRMAHPLLRDVGEFEWRLYASADSTSITETKSSTGLALGANTDEIRWGQVTNTTANLTSYHDDLAVSTADWLGPASAPVTPAMQPRRMPLGV